MSILPFLRFNFLLVLYVLSWTAIISTSELDDPIIKASINNELRTLIIYFNNTNHNNIVTSTTPFRLHDQSQADDMHHDSSSLISNHRFLMSPSTYDSSYCVYNASALRKADRAAPDNRPIHTRIDICVPVIRLFYPLMIDKKWIKILCNRQWEPNGKCIIDGQNRFRWLDATNSNIILQRIDFIRAISRDNYISDRAAFYLHNTDIAMIKTSFRMNHIPGDYIVNITSDNDDCYPKVLLQNVIFENNEAVCFYFSYLHIHICRFDMTDMTAMDSLKPSFLFFTYIILKFFRIQCYISIDAM